MKRILILVGLDNLLRSLLIVGLLAAIMVKPILSGSKYSVLVSVGLSSMVLNSGKESFSLSHHIPVFNRDHLVEVNGVFIGANGARLLQNTKLNAKVEMTTNEC